MGDLFSGGARKKAKKAQQEQEAQIQKQTQLEKARLAESQSDVSRRKASAKAGQGGRSLLQATPAATATSTTLGG